MNDRIIGYFIENHEQGLFPPNNYFNELIYYDDSDIQHTTPLLKYEWTKELKKHFNNLLYVYYYDRTIFYDVYKYPIDKPIITYNNLRKTIAYILESKMYNYQNLYNAMIAEYNPLWNVDGTETTVRELKQTGTDKFEKAGTDTTSNSGSDVTTGQKTTYDTSFLDSDKSTLEHGLESETEYDSSNTETRNLTDKETITVERHGNIGVTKSSELVMDTVELYQDIDIYKYMVHDIVNQITYGIY